MTKRVLTALAMIAALNVPTAEALTARGDLEKWCRQGSAAASGRCIGYLLAAEDALATDSIDGIRACLPPGIKLPEQHRIVLDWLGANPDAQDSSAMSLVARAYAERYPCKP